MGRKPLHDTAMTATERSRRCRDSKKAKGVKELHFALDESTAALIDQLVLFFELPGRAEVVSDLLQWPLDSAVQIMRDWEANQDVPSPDQLNGADQESLKNIKHMLWNNLCATVQQPESKEV